MRSLRGFSAIVFACGLGLLGSCKPDCLLIPDPPSPKILSYDEVHAWDISTYAAQQDQLPSFFDSSGAPINIFQFMRSNGVNTIRLRIIHGKPSFPHPTLDQLLWVAKIAQQQKLALWLDFHYSDDWADPGRQATPNNWKNLSIQALRDTVQLYTYSVVAKFCAQNTAPAIVQIGNEISPGMLWPLGNYSGSESQAQSTATLFNAGAKGCKEASLNTKIMLHLAPDASLLNTGKHFAKYMQFDLWGFSYYGNWHGCNDSLVFNNFQALSDVNQKPFIIAETAYPHTLGWLDNTNNVFGMTSQLCPGYSASPQGQLAWLKKTWNHAKAKPSFQGMGIWEPAWVTSAGKSGNQGSSWENVCLFDFNHKALPAASFGW